jgi:hypothetical protein
LDRDLRARERSGSDDPAALVALARAHERAGRIDDAARSLWRARALGGDALPLPARVPASPWPTPDGEGRAGFSRALGPRAGRIVASGLPFRGGPARVVVDAEGTLVVALPPLAGNSRIVRVHPDTLAPLDEVTFPSGRSAPELSVGPDSVLIASPAQVARWSRTLDVTFVAEEPDSVIACEALGDGRVLIATERGRIAVDGRAFTCTAPLRALVVGSDRRRVACLTGGFFGNLEVYSLDDGARLSSFEIRARTGGLGARHDDSFSLIDTIDEGQLFPPTHLASLRRHGSSGAELWVREVGYADEGLEVAVGPDGNAWVITEEQLALYGPDGTARWHDAERVVSPVPIAVDGEGVAFVAGRWGLVAYAPEKKVLFEVAGSLAARAIDARGRLVAERSNGPERELVLID